MWAVLISSLWCVRLVCRSWSSCRPRAGGLGVIAAAVIPAAAVVVAWALLLLWRAVASCARPDRAARSRLAFCRPWRLRLASARLLHVGGLRLALFYVVLYVIFVRSPVWAVNVACHCLRSFLPRVVVPAAALVTFQKSFVLLR